MTDKLSLTSLCTRYWVDDALLQTGGSLKAPEEIHTVPKRNGP